MTVKAKAEAKRDTLLARASAMKKKHAVEMEAVLLCKKLEEMQIETETEASDAEAVLRAFSQQDGMESYYEKTKQKTVLPDVKAASSITLDIEHLPVVRRDVPITQHNDFIISAQNVTLPVTRGEMNGNVAHAINDNSTLQILQKQNENLHC